MSSIFIKDGNGATVQIFTFEDSTSVHHNASVPITETGVPIFTTVAPGIVCVAGTPRVSVDNLVAVSINGPLPAGTQHLGKVSVEGLTIGAGSGLTVSVGGPVSAQAVPMAGTDGSNYRLLKTHTDGALLVHVCTGATGGSGGDVSVSPTQGSIPVSIANIPTVSVNGFAKVHVCNAFTVSIADKVSVAGRVSIADSTLAVTQSGTWNVGALTSINSIVKVSIEGTLPGGSGTPQVSVGGPVSVQATQIAGTDGTNLRVLLTDTTGALAITSIKDDVSIAPQTLITHVSNTVNVSVMDKVSVAGTVNAVQSGTWTVQPGNTANTTAWLVSVNGIPKVSVADSTLAVTQSGTWNIAALTSINSIIRVSIEGTLPGGSGTPQVSIGGAVSTQATQIAFTDGTNARTPLVNTGGNILVHVCNSLPTPPAADATQLVSIGGPVSVQAVQIAGVDGSGNARTPLMTTTGSLVVHVSNAAPGGGGSSITVSVGGAVSLQAIPIGVRDTGGDVRQPLVNTGGNLLVHVCNAAPGGGGGSPQVSIGGAVSNQATQIAGVDTAGNARTPLLDVSGTQKVGGYTTNPEYVFTRPTDVVSYAIGDLVANSTVAGTVVPMSWPVSRLTGGGGSIMIRRARIITPNDNRTTDRSFRLHLFNVASGVSATNGDNGVFAPTLVSTYVGYLDVPMHLSAATGAAGVGAPGGGGDINIELASGQVSISGFLEARTSILPASGAIYRVALELYQD